MGKINEDGQKMIEEEESLVSSFIKDPACNAHSARNLKAMEKARRYTLETLGTYGAEAVAELVDLMRNSDKDDIKLRAALKLIEYNVGRPPEMKIQNDGKTVSLSDDEFEEIIVDGNEEKLQKIIENRYGKDSKRG